MPGDVLDSPAGTDRRRSPLLRREILEERKQSVTFSGEEMERLDGWQRSETHASGLRRHGRGAVPGLRESRTIEAEARRRILGFALERQIGHHLPDYGTELEAVPRARGGDDDLRVHGVAIDDEVLIRRHGVTTARR